MAAAGPLEDPGIKQIPLNPNVFLLFDDFRAPEPAGQAAGELI